MSTLEEMQEQRYNLVKIRDNKYFNQKQLIDIENAIWTLQQRIKEAEGNDEVYNDEWGA